MLVDSHITALYMQLADNSVIWVKDMFIFKTIVHISPVNTQL